MNNIEDKVLYIYDLPYTERRNLCEILDINNAWEELGGRYLKFRFNELEKFRRAEFCEKSPTDRMLQEWGMQNNTVDELYLYLYQMGHYQAMSAIKSCVPAKYHVLCETKRNYKSLFGNGGFPGACVATTNKGASDGNFAHEGTSKPTLSSEHPPTFVPQQQKHNQELKAEGSGSFEEGACALVNSALKYGSDNLNQVTFPSRQHMSSSKVPETFLNPASAGIAQSAKLPNKFMGESGVLPEKIINHEPCGRITEVSCEDNNPDELPQSKSKHIHYDPMQDYLRKVEEKRAKEFSYEAAMRDVMHCSNVSGGMQKSKSNGATFINPEAAAIAYLPSLPPSAFQNERHHPQQSVQERERRISNASDSSRRGEFIVPLIPYKELEEATSCWSKDHLLGRGGFGTVYKGVWKNTQVAIKRINLQENADLDSARLQINQSLDELKLLESFRHDNILPVYGYSADQDQSPCLVYQFMPNGSVEDRLQLRKIHGLDEGTASNSMTPLIWWQRYRIAHGTAKALQYLHTVKERPLIHGDVKSANILLDMNMEPKLGDFGLAREGKSQSTSLKVSRVHGTKPYLPSDYLRSKKLSVKVDTYSYGIVLFELCTGLRAYDEKRKEGAKFLKELVDDTSDIEILRDKSAGPEPNGNIFSALFKIAKECVMHLPSRRPDMEKVFSDLKSFGEVIVETANARKISRVEIAPKSPLQLQWKYDISAQSPSLTPSTQPSLPVVYYPSHVPSDTLLLYPSPSSSFLRPQSPVPPSVSPHSPVPPLYSPHPSTGFSYHPPIRPHCSPVNWKQDMGDGFHYGVGAHVPHININHATANCISSRDPPPSYNEAMSPDVNKLLGTNSSLNPLLPQLSDLNINSNSQHPTGKAGSGYTDGSSSVYSHLASSTQDVARGKYPSQGSTSSNTYLPTVISHHMSKPANDDEICAANIPLLTTLGTSDTNYSSNFGKPPTAKNKASILD